MRLGRLYFLASPTPVWDHATHLEPGSLTSSISKPESRHLLPEPPLHAELSHLTVVHRNHFHQNYSDHLLPNPLASRPSLPTRRSLLNPATRGILLKCESGQIFVSSNLQRLSPQLSTRPCDAFPLPLRAQLLLLSL